MTTVRLLALFGLAFLVLASNVAVSILYMVVYGHLIDPGHEPKYYQEHIQSAGPYCSIVAGIPILFLAGWWVAGWWQRSLGVRGALVVWLVYTIVDLLILFMAGLSLGVGILFVVSFATKLGAVYWGATTRLQKQTKPTDAHTSPMS